RPGSAHSAVERRRLSVWPPRTAPEGHAKAAPRSYALLETGAPAGQAPQRPIALTERHRFQQAISQPVGQTDDRRTDDRPRFLQLGCPWSVVWPQVVAAGQFWKSWSANPAGLLPEPTQLPIWRQVAKPDPLFSFPWPEVWKSDCHSEAHGG